MPFCTQCGHENSAQANFCSNCGARLLPPGPTPDATSTLALQREDIDRDDAQLLSETDRAAVDALRPGSALLVVLRGPNSGSRFLLDEDVVTAGRHPDSDIFLDDVTVSRRHAEFHRTPTGYRVRDVGSLNGTYVNRDRISDEVSLVGGDEVQIGKYRLVHYGSQRAPASGP